MCAQFQELSEAKSTICKLQQKLENAEAIVDIKSDFDRYEFYKYYY